MSQTTTTDCCEAPRMMVTAGVVRCVACDTWFHDHPDSAPAPGVVEANQYR